MKDFIETIFTGGKYICHFCGKKKHVKWIGVETDTLFCSKRCLKKWLKAP
jgi:endogenous inhibitor of DNA gyrase (YacG/DUF329 family)